MRKVFRKSWIGWVEGWFENDKLDHVKGDLYLIKKFITLFMKKDLLKKRGLNECVLKRVNYSVDDTANNPYKSKKNI